MALQKLSTHSAAAIDVASIRSDRMSWRGRAIASHRASAGGSAVIDQKKRSERLSEKRLRTRLNSSFVVAFGAIDQHGDEPTLLVMRATARATRRHSFAVTWVSAWPPGLGVGVVTEGFDERLGFGLYSLSPVTPTPSLHCLPIYPSDAINRPEDRRKQKKPRVREVECAGQERVRAPKGTGGARRSIQHCRCRSRARYPQICGDRNWCPTTKAPPTANRTVASAEGDGWPLRMWGRAVSFCSQLPRP